MISSQISTHSKAQVSSARTMACRKPFQSSRPVTRCCSSKGESEATHWGAVAGAVALTASLQLGIQAPAMAVTGVTARTYDEIQALTYNEVKGTGLASTCPVIEPPSVKADLASGKYSIQELCMEPTAFYVREEGGERFNPTRVLTRQTYTLAGMTGQLDVSGSGPTKIALNEDGLDYAAVSLQPQPAGEYVPLLFTARNMVAEGNNGELQGTYVVPSYRGATFMDPKGRGSAQGYNYTVGLQAVSDDDFTTNSKSAAPSTGEAKLKVEVMDRVTGEIGGTFEMLQPSDDDLGAKAPLDVAVVGVWYARVG